MNHNHPRAYKLRLCVTAPIPHKIGFLMSIQPNKKKFEKNVKF